MQPTIGILTSGGDCQALNAAIRAVVKAAEQRRWRVLGYERGYAGLVEHRRVCLCADRVRGKLRDGGTLLGSGPRCSPYTYPAGDQHTRALANLAADGVQGLIVIGGDGSLDAAHRLSVDARAVGYALPVIGIPKTIDNDVLSTEQTIGFDTAVSIATEAIDRLHTTAEAHERVMVVETMGRSAGWLALASGIAGGADVILLPEVPYQLEHVYRAIATRRRANLCFSVVVVAEGARSVDGAESVTVNGAFSGQHRYGGAAQAFADALHARDPQLDVRVTQLGHLQRGGTPTAADRLLASQMGVAAVDTLAREIESGRRGSRLIALHDQSVTDLPLASGRGTPRQVAPDDALLMTARGLGIALGDGVSHERCARSDSVVWSAPASTPPHIANWHWPAPSPSG